MSDDFRFAHCTVHLLRTAGLHTHGAIRSTTSDDLLRMLRETNRREEVFEVLPGRRLCVYLVQNLDAPDDREVVEMDLPGDNDFPFWGSARLRTSDDGASDPRRYGLAATDDSF